MISFLATLILLGILLTYGILEYQFHQKYVSSIPVRIHINGTRGKSSVTRLIGAGLRAGGYKTFTKVTGTFPRIIMPDGTEAAIHRKEKANILEQLKVIKFCSKQKADVLIIECMALQPQYQRITELQMVKSTIGVITNIRLDHLDVMGPRLRDVGHALCGTIPKNSKIFTSEDRCLNWIKEVAKKRKTEVHNALASTISDKDMEGFAYIEHKDNVALALDICASLGVGKEIALEEMKKTFPDEGVLTKSTVHIKEKKIDFYNGFAANDPESSLMIWNSILQTLPEEEHVIVLINTRKDRQDRARQLIELAAKELEFDQIALMGESVELVVDMTKSHKIDQTKVQAIGNPNTEILYERLSEISKNNTTIIGFGNMGAGGAELVAYYEEQKKIRRI
jgi:gamma-polyglutamate synthase